MPFIHQVFSGMHSIVLVIRLSIYSYVSSSHNHRLFPIIHPSYFCVLIECHSTCHAYTFFSVFLFHLVYLFQNLITYMFLKFHRVTKSIYIIKVHWISLWIDYLAARMINKSIKHGMCDRSAKDAYSIMTLDRTSKFFYRSVFMFLPWTLFVSPYVFKENLIGVFQLLYLLFLH